MARVLDALAEAGALVIEWCVLDAQWFGVPQRRRRVFVTACFDPPTADRCPDPLFPVAPSGTRNPRPCDKTRETITGVATHSIGTDNQTRKLEHSIPYVKARRAQSSEDYETWISDAPNPTLNEFDGGDKRSTTIVVGNNVTLRRLTPLECERLQGFPDNHTLHRADGKTNSDSTRYKQCGNAIATPVAKWIAKQLKGTL